MGKWGGGGPQLYQQVLQITPTTCANPRLTNLGAKNVMVVVVVVGGIVLGHPG